MARECTRHSGGDSKRTTTTTIRTTPPIRDTRGYLFSKTISTLRFLDALDLFDEAELGPILARHQIVVHAAGEVLLGDVAAHRVLIAILGQAAHVPDHGALATAFMVQREAAALRRRRREQPLRERVRGHNTPLHGCANVMCTNTPCDERARYPSTLTAIRHLG